MLLSLLLLLLVLALLVRGLGFWGGVVAAFLVMRLWWRCGAAGPPLPWLFWIVAVLLVALAVLFGYRPWRRRWVTPRILPLMKPLLPRISDTEAEALEAGTVWWDGDLFSGDPDWRALLDFQVDALPARERAFLDGPVEDLCAKLDDWQITQDGDLPPEVWELLKRERFFGLIIPERYGGLGFSARGHSAVVTKLGSRSTTAAVTVMVPNSLGPAELLLHYGTDGQREHWLPRLASGEEIPCFALTGPENGSDAAAMDAHGIICRGTWEGREALGARLTWAKRYSTLGPVATVIGLAVKLYDPEHLLGETVDLGITLALVPAGLPGIRIGERHDPMGVAFQNGPNWGEDVFVPLDLAVIGGREMVGQGWRMLMDCLAAGRSISLPSMSCGGSQYAVRFAGAYTTVRRQFGLSVGRFEGVQEALARMGGHNYWMNAVRTLTAAAVDAGEKPSVLSAIAKAWCTEGMRDVISDAMDVVGGAGLSRGPKNALAREWQAAPIGITVEGANILTRSMIVFGQGAIRCHPFVQEELRAAEDGDLVRFDRAFFGHLSFVVCNLARSFGRALVNPPVFRARGSFAVRRRMARLSRLSAAFAALADVAMATLGGNLKRKELITGRFADALAWMYAASASLKRYVDEGEGRVDAPAMCWAVDHAVARTQDALAGILHNLPLRPVAWLLWPLIFPLGRRYKAPRDELAVSVARGLIEAGEARIRHTAGIYTPPPDEPGLGELEAVLAQVLRAAPIDKRLREALREGRLEVPLDGTSVARRAAELGILTDAEAEQHDAAEAARARVVRVDAFSPEAYRSMRG